MHTLMQFLDRFLTLAVFFLLPIHEPICPACSHDGGRVRSLRGLAVYRCRAGHIFDTSARLYPTAAYEAAQSYATAHSPASAGKPAR